jgi:hypothetical protein
VSAVDSVWVKTPATDKDIDDVYRLGEWVLRCQITYPDRLGGGRNWIIERADRKPIIRGDSRGLMLAHFDRPEEVPLKHATEIIEEYEAECRAEVKPCGAR